MKSVENKTKIKSIDDTADIFKYKHKVMVC